MTGWQWDAALIATCCAVVSVVALVILMVADRWHR